MCVSISFIQVRKMTEVIFNYGVLMSTVEIREYFGNA